MSKVVKVYVSNIEESENQLIFIIRHQGNEDLNCLKEKLNYRCPQLRNEKHLQIFWFDLEGDKIKVSCDDDLKFFIEETSVMKLYIECLSESDFSTRKRPINDDGSEYSKRIRIKMQEIDLGSDSSSTMDTSMDDLSSSSVSIDVVQAEPEIQIVNENEEMIPLTSSAPEQQIEEQPHCPKVKIISVDIIQEADNVTPTSTEIPDQNGNQVVPDNVEALPVVQMADQQPSTSKAQQKIAEPNRIVISDSSDDEPEDLTNNNGNRFGQARASASAYSFSGHNSDRYDSRRQSNHSGHYHFHNHHHGSRRDRSRAERNFERVRRIHDNAERIHHQSMENVQNHVRMAREHAMRAVRASTSAIPDLVSTFQAHFQRPMFSVADINQQIFGSFGRR